LRSVPAPDGPDVASITYSVDGSGPTTVPGARATVTVPAVAAADGSHALVFFANDVGHVSEPERTLTVNLDTVKPTTVALAPTTVRRHRMATLRFRVDDARPNGGTARVVIEVRTRAGRALAKEDLGLRQVNAPQTAKIRASFVKGTYRFVVSARDRAGNPQSSQGSAKLTVR
jgi:hypothetical protein